MKMLILMQQSPARACLDCEVRRALRLSQHSTRKPKVGRAARDQPEFLGLGYKERGGGGFWKCASTRKSTQDIEEPEVGSQHQQLGEASQAKRAKHDSVGVQAALGVLWFYKNGISPLLPKSCRFIPTCSSYSVEAYQGFGFWKGSVLTTWRVLRCNPFSKGGFDPPQWPPIGLHWAFGQARIRDRL